MDLLTLLKLFFPSWRFFEELGAIPQLQYRYKQKNETMGDWILWQPIQIRQWSHLFLNSTTNLYMACNSMIERLINDSNEWTSNNSNSFSGAVSYKLVEQLIRLHLKDASPQAQTFQFRVGTSQIDAVLSLEHKV